MEHHLANAEAFDSSGRLRELPELCGGHAIEIPGGERLEDGVEVLVAPAQAELVSHTMLTQIL